MLCLNNNHHVCCWSPFSVSLLLLFYFFFLTEKYRKMIHYTRCTSDTYLRFEYFYYKFKYNQMKTTSSKLKECLSKMLQIISIDSEDLNLKTEIQSHLVGLLYRNKLGIVCLVGIKDYPIDYYRYWSLVWILFLAPFVCLSDSLHRKIFGIDLSKSVFISDWILFYVYSVAMHCFHLRLLFFYSNSFYFG